MECRGGVQPHEFQSDHAKVDSVNGPILKPRCSQRAAVTRRDSRPATQMGASRGYPAPRTTSPSSGWAYAPSDHAESQRSSDGFQPTLTNLLFDFDFYILSGGPNWKALHTLPGRWGYDCAGFDVESGTVPRAGDLIAGYGAL
jgi:hypothetical protein